MYLHHLEQTQTIKENSVAEHEHNKLTSEEEHQMTKTAGSYVCYIHKGFSYSNSDREYSRTVLNTTLASAHSFKKKNYVLGKKRELIYHNVYQEKVPI